MIIAKFPKVTFERQYLPANTNLQQWVFETSGKRVNIVASTLEEASTQAQQTLDEQAKLDGITPPTSWDLQLIQVWSLDLVTSTVLVSRD